MPKRAGVLMIIAVFVIIGIASWQSGQKKEEALKTTGKLMRVARYYWPGSFWIEIADKKGWFKEAGLNVTLIDTNPDYYASLQNMVDGKIDANNFPLFDLMRYISQGKDLVAVINTDLSSGVDAIIVKKEIQHIRDLKGKRVGIQNDTYSEYFLDVVLERFGLSLDDVIKVEVPAEKAAEALLQEVADAVITWEPLASEAIKKADARRLFDSSQIPGINAGVMVFHRRFIGERPQDVQAFVNVWQKTVEFIKENPKEAFGIIAKIYGVNPGEAQALAQIDKILDVRDNVTAFSYAAGLESLHGLARRMNDFMVGKGMTEKRLDSTDFLDARFIAALKNKF